MQIALLFMKVNIAYLQPDFLEVKYKSQSVAYVELYRNRVCQGNDCNGDGRRHQNVA
jgi:hypothetical protein